MKKYLILALFAVLGMGMGLGAPAISTSYEVTPASINPGGTAQVIVTVNNLDLTTSLENLKIELKSRTPGISVTSGTATPGDVPALSTSSGAFTVKALQSATPGTYIVEAAGRYEYGGAESSSFVLSIPITVSYRSNLEIYSPDTQVTPGGTENLLITLRNAGKSQIRDLVVTLSSALNAVQVVGNVRDSIEIIQPGSSDEVSFQIKASSTALPGIQSMTLTVTYTDAAGSTQTDTQSLGVTIVDAGTEVVIDSIESNLEPGTPGKVTIGVKNVGASNLEKLYFSLRTGEVTITTGPNGQPVITTGSQDTTLRVRGSNEMIIDSLAVGETKYVEFEFDVSQDALAFPVSATLMVNYLREGSKNQIVDNKPLGLVIGGKPDLQVIDLKLSTAGNQIEVDIANYGNKDANAIKVDALSGGKIFGTGFADTIKTNKHKVFRFDLPRDANVLIRMEYKDYESANGTKVVQESFTLDSGKMVKAADGTGSIVIVILLAALFAWWYMRKKKRDGIRIDVSKYKKE